MSGPFHQGKVSETAGFERPAADRLYTAPDRLYKAPKSLYKDIKYYTKPNQKISDKDLKIIYKSSEYC